MGLDDVAPAPAGLIGRYGGEGEAEDGTPLLGRLI
ncbi:hypothetical protein ACP70R_038452 [Stipagrostis hirtigluma subsp. patula]